MRLLYNFLFLAFFALSSPYYFWRLWRRGNWQRGFAQRFASYDSKFKQAITNRHTLWMHAVSVGEVNVLTQIIRALEPRLPNLKIVVSTTTTTGMGVLQSRLPSHISKIYFPIDRRRWVTRALTAVHPKAIVLVEAEIWPNFLWKASDLGIPIFLVNARLSERSFRGYKRFRFLFRGIFKSFAAVGVQNEADAARLQQLGCRPEAIHVVGSLKFDAAKLDERRLLDVPAMLERLGVARDARIIVAGSTHAGEEAILAEQFQRLRRQFPDLFLVIVPRHFERSKEIGKALSTLGLKFAYRSEITDDSQFRPSEVDCLLVNSTGELKHFYESATVIFVGKSLTAQGGQNPIEPAALGKAMVFGPNMDNFADVVRTFLARDGAVQVQDSAGLEAALAETLGSQARRDQLGRNALAAYQENLGGIDRTVEMIVQRLSGGELYVAPKNKA